MADTKTESPGPWNGCTTCKGTRLVPCRGCIVENCTANDRCPDCLNENKHRRGDLIRRQRRD